MVLSCGMRAQIGGFVLHVLLLLVLFLDVIDNIFLFGGKIFWIEIAIITGLVVMAAIGIREYARQGSRALLFVYGAMLLNVIVLSSIAVEFFWLSLVFAAAGTAVSLRKRKKKRRHDDFSDVRVEEVKPEAMGAEMLTRVQEPIVESRVITKTPAKAVRKRRKAAAKRKK